PRDAHCRILAAGASRRDLSRGVPPAPRSQGRPLAGDRRRRQDRVTARVRRADIARDELRLFRRLRALALPDRRRRPPRGSASNARRLRLLPGYRSHVARRDQLRLFRNERAVEHRRQSDRVLVLRAVGAAEAPRSLPAVQAVPEREQDQRVAMKPRITLITLGVDDLERSLRFYRDGLGLATEGIIGTQFEHGAVAFFELQSGLRLALWPRASIAHDTGLRRSPPSPTDFTIAHNVGSKAEVDAVMAQAE